MGFGASLVFGQVEAATDRGSEVIGIGNPLRIRVHPNGVNEAGRVAHSWQINSIVVARVHRATYFLFFRIVGITGDRLIQPVRYR